MASATASNASTASSSAADQSSTILVYYKTAASATASLSAAGRQPSPPRPRRRRDHGLRHYVLVRGGTTASAILVGGRTAPSRPPRHRPWRDHGLRHPRPRRDGGIHPLIRGEEATSTSPRPRRDAAASTSTTAAGCDLRVLVRGGMRRPAPLRPRRGAGVHLCPRRDGGLRRQEPLHGVPPAPQARGWSPAAAPPPPAPAALPPCPSSPRVHVS